MSTDKSRVRVSRDRMWERERAKLELKKNSYPRRLSELYMWILLSFSVKTMLPQFGVFLFDLRC